MHFCLCVPVVFRTLIVAVVAVIVLILIALIFIIIIFASPSLLPFVFLLSTCLPSLTLNENIEKGFFLHANYIMLLCVRARLSAPTPDSLHARAREAKIKFDELNKCGGKGGSESGGKGGEGGNASGSEDEDNGASPPSAAEDATAKAAAEKAAAEKAAPSERRARASAGTPTRPTGSMSTKGGNGASPAMKKSATTLRAVEGGESDSLSSDDDDLNPPSKASAASVAVAAAARAAAAAAAASQGGVGGGGSALPGRMPRRTESSGDDWSSGS